MNEFAPQTSFNLNCTLQYPGNPPSKLQLERTSKEKNVRITTTKTSLTYEVQNATIKNRDNFTCIAVNTQGRTYSSNMVYVGGELDPSNYTLLIIINYRCSKSRQSHY